MEHTQKNKVNLVDFRELKKNRLLEYESQIEKKIKDILNNITYNKKIFVIQIDSKNYVYDVVDIIMRLLNDKKYGYFDIYKFNESFFSDKLNLYIKFIDNKKFEHKYISKLESSIKKSVKINEIFFCIIVNKKYGAYNRRITLLRNLYMLTDNKYKINTRYRLGQLYDDLLLEFS